MDSKTIVPGYELIKLPLGCSVKTAVDILLDRQEIGRPSYVVFNGEVLYSDTVTMDLAHLAITGMRFEEFNIFVSKTLQEGAERKNLREARAIELRTELISRGREVLSENRWEAWEQIVVVRVSDENESVILKCALDIIHILNTGGNLIAAKDLINIHKFKGAGWNLVRYIVRMMCDRGEEFYNFRR